MSGRNVGDVIDQLIEGVKFTDNERSRLLGIKSSAAYTAPEAMAGRWLQVRDILVGKFANAPLGDEQALKAQSIFVGEGAA